ncbi:hypothetical protein DSM104443_02265 [Usitatibacter rugosus]|uniref:Tetratricopeptide repeat protein n=1 Tax=Usitatibacter rugosus TaxID=2732067 RepID=A0A6M4GVZ1_9PROT|nr:hypothetical protein [Usitatibacter rugosus]QJR11192.1 hypothetical protein DSM104443_02265 [Usitatibacter rugosus]
MTATAAPALAEEAVRLHLEGAADESLALCDKVILHYRNSRDAGEKAAVDRALCSKAAVLDELGRKDEAISLHDEVIERNSPPADLESRRLLADSLLAKACIVQSLGTDEAVAEALECYRLVLPVREMSDDPVLVEIESRALLGEGYARFVAQRGFVQSFSWGEKRALFKCLDRSVEVLAECPHDTDALMLQAAKAVILRAQLLRQFGDAKAADKSVTAIERSFGAARAQRIAGFMELEQNLDAMAAAAGTRSMGVFLP